MIDRILERLKKAKEIGNSCIGCDYKENCIPSNCEKRAFDLCTEIVQEVAKDGGWIPCSEQMPQENKLILIYAESTARGGSIRCVAELRNGFWFAQIASDTLGLTGIGQFKVIAWQPLPASYIPKED